MVNTIDFMSTYGCYRGGAWYETLALVPDNDYMWIDLNNNAINNYNNKYSGAAYIYVPSHTGRYAFHVACESRTSGAYFVGMEIESTDSTHFRFNYISGTLIDTGATTDRYTDGRTWTFNTWYKVAWFVDTGGPNDTLWVNNVSRAIGGIPNKNVTLILNTHLVMLENTPANFRLAMLMSSLDPGMSFTEMSNLFTKYVGKSPIYLGPGYLTQTSRTRPLYIDCGAPVLTNHATGQVFEYKTPGTIQIGHVLGRVAIA